MVSIILPQALKNVLPALANEFINNHKVPSLTAYQMHLYDIHESPKSNDFDDLYYKKGELGCIHIPSLDRTCSLDPKGAVRSRKNLSITLKFIFDAESKQLCAVGLKEQIVVNASLVLSIGKNASLPLFLKQL